MNKYRFILCVISVLLFCWLSIGGMSAERRLPELGPKLGKPGPIKLGYYPAPLRTIHPGPLPAPPEWVIQQSSTSQSGRRFNVADYGAKHDGSTSDVTAIKDAFAAASANSGKSTVVFPAGTYRIPMGDPASDPNISTQGAYKALFVITASNIVLEFQPGAVLDVVTTHLYQDCAAQFAPNTTTVFYTTSNYIRFEGHGSGKATLTLSGVNYCNAGTGVANGADGFQFLAAASPSIYVSTEGMIYDGFIGWAFIGGESVANTAGVTEELAHFVAINNKFLNWGGDGHDSNMYVWGRMYVAGNEFVTNRNYASHAIYSGSNKPDSRIIGNYFKGIDIGTGGVAIAGNKYAVQMYAEGSGTEVRDCIMTDNVVDSCNAGFVIWKNGTGRIGNHNIIANNICRGANAAGTIIAGPCIDLRAPNNTVVTGTSVYNYQKGIAVSASSSTGFAGVMINGFVCDGVGICIDTGNNGQGLVVANGTIRNIPASGTGVIANSSYVTIDSIYVDLGSNASTTGINLGYPSAGANANDISISHCTITGSVSTQKALYFVLNAAVTITRVLIDGNLINMSAGTGVSYVGNSGNGTFTDFTYVNNRITATTAFTVGGTVNSSSTATILNSILTGAIVVGSGNMTATVKDSTINGTLTTTTGLFNRGGNTIGSNYEFIASTGSSFTPNAGLYSEFRYTFNANGTVNNPIQPLDNQIIRLVIIQDATGTRTLTLGSAFATSPAGGNMTCLNNGVAQTGINTTANTHTELVYKYRLSTTKWYPLSCVTNIVQ